MSKDKPEAFETFEFDLPPIRGFPELRWAGKRPFKSTQYFPAQKKESYGDPTDGWWNRIFWGDNLQVMSHLLRDFRGKVDLIYVDPPFDTGVNYGKNIKFKSANTIENNQSSFEEKQYKDIWINDEFSQFIYERIILCKELLSESGSLVVHCNPNSAHMIRSLCDEIFSPNNFRNEIVWVRTSAGKPSQRVFPTNTDRLIWYSKGEDYKFEAPVRPLSETDIATFNKDDGDGRGAYNTQPIINPAYRPNLRYVFVDKKGRSWQHPANGWRVTEDRLRDLDERDRLQFSDNGIREKYYLSERLELGKQVPDHWSDVPGNSVNYSSESTGYPTQKPESLLNRVVNTFTKPGDLVLDCFMGSGTTQAACMKLGRRFVGADINLGSVETTIKRLNEIRLKISDLQQDLFKGKSEGRTSKIFAGFEVYNVNNYELFRNPVEAKELIREAMELQPLPPSSAFDGQREGYLVKIMPVNRIATRQDLNEVINGLDFKAFERRQAEAPNKPVERIHLVCMGHEPDLGPALQKEAKPFDIDVMVTDLIRDKAHLHFKKSSDARLAIENGELVIKGFYPMNLLQKLSLESDAVDDWRQLVESVKVDFNYDGAVLTPAVVDAPGKDELVAGRYPIPADAATVRVKITDLLSESWEGDIEHG